MWHIDCKNTPETIFFFLQENTHKQRFCIVSHQIRPPKLARLQKQYLSIFFFSWKSTFPDFSKHKMGTTLFTEKKDLFRSSLSTKTYNVPAYLSNYLSGSPGDEMHDTASHMLVVGIDSQ